MNYPNFSNISINQTVSDKLTRETWDFPTIFIFIFCTTVVLNVTVLVILCKDNMTLNRPFSVYQIFLLSLNLVYAIVQNPLDILNSIFPVWWLGSPACSTYLYATYVIAACVIHSHVLITLNRLWAVAFPIHYRHHHSRIVAVGLCMGTLIYVHICMAPGWLMDMVIHR